MAKEINKLSDIYSRTDPIGNYNFMLRVEGMTDLPCRSVSGFSVENEYDYLQEGGVNDFVHLLRKPVSKPNTITIERYALTNEKAKDPLPDGGTLIFPLLLFVARRAGDFDKTKRAYCFTGCTVIKKEYGELNAEKSGLLIEKTTISYREMVVVTVPIDNEMGIKEWKFEGKNPLGNNQRSAITLKDNKLDEKDKRKWLFDGDNPQGKGERSAYTGTIPKKPVKQ